MAKTIAGTYTINGYTALPSTQGTLNPFTVLGSIDLGSSGLPAALYAQGPNPWTITNQGSITGGKVAAIALAAGGVITNAASAFLGGHFGVSILGTPGTLGSVTNAGTISAINAGATDTANKSIGVFLSTGGGVLNQTGGQITAQGAGIDILFGAGTVVNYGAVSGTTYDGVYLDHGSVTNKAGATITGAAVGTSGTLAGGGTVAPSGWGIAIRTGGTLFNAGIITGAGQGGAFLGGGTAASTVTATNTGQGTITGYWGIAMTGGPGTVVNAGSLNGFGQSGVFLTGGSVTNSTGGRITGIGGVVIRNAVGTVSNSGFIGSTFPVGYSVYLAKGFPNRVIANPGAVFSGSVNGGNTIGATSVSTLELGAAAQQGTVSGIGTQFVNFGAAAVDPGASWSVSGLNSLVAGATLLNAGTLALNGVLMVDGVLTAASSGLLTLGQTGNGRLVVENQGSILAAGAAAAGSGVDIGQSAGSAGEAIVTGGKSFFGNAGAFIVGDAGLGDLAIQFGGTVVTGPGTIVGLAGAVVGNAAGSGGSSVTVSGAGSNWRVTGSLVAGAAAAGSIVISAGGSVSASSLDTGTQNGGSGAVTVSDANSNLAIAGRLDVGDAGSGVLSISGGATVSAGSLDAGNIAAAVGQIGVSGAGSALLIANDATVADDGTGVLSVLSGATFSAASLTIGSQGDSSGALVVSGSGSVVNLSGAINIGTALGTGDLTVGPGAAVHASVVNLQGQVVLEGGLLDPTVNLINQGQTAGGFGTLAAGDIVDEGVIQAGGTKPTQRLLLVQGTVVGGGTLSKNGTVLPSSPAGLLQINAGGTMELTGPVLNAATTTFQDALTPTGTYTIANSVIDVSFADAAGVLLLDDIAGFGGTITTFKAGDQFVITGGTLSNVGISNGNTLTFADSGVNAGAGGIDQIIFGSAVNAGQFNIVNGNTMQAVACFAAGTRIATADGPVAVERLRVGGQVLNHRGEAKAIVWIGSRGVDCERHPRPETVWPVRVAAGAFGENVPVRDLYLSPDHAVFVNDVLIPVKLLVNGYTITQTQSKRIIYYHIELARHEVMLAEGLAVESYLDMGDRSDFRGGEAIRLFPTFAAKLAPNAANAWEARGVAPLVTTGDVLAAARVVVAANAPHGRLSSARPVSSTR